VHSDPSAEPSLPPPDQVPEDLLARYERQARRTVRYHRSMRYRLTRRVHGVARSADPQVWETTAVVFCLAVVALLFAGGLAYAVFLWPTIGITLIATLVTLLAVSFFIARRITRKDPEKSEPLAF
jgi:hypothetical protein